VPAQSFLSTLRDDIRQTSFTPVSDLKLQTLSESVAQFGTWYRCLLLASWYLLRLSSRLTFLVATNASTLLSKCGFHDPSCLWIPRTHKMNFTLTYSDDTSILPSYHHSIYIDRDLICSKRRTCWSGFSITVVFVPFSLSIFHTVWISPTRLPLHVVHDIIHSTYNFTTCIHVYNTSFPCIRHVAESQSRYLDLAFLTVMVFTPYIHSHTRDMHIHVSFTPSTFIITRVYSHDHVHVHIYISLTYITIMFFTHCHSFIMYSYM